VKKLLFYFSLFTFHFSSFAQDSCGIRISLLTCTPGTELYSTFGHSALRIVDSNNNTDIVFNYGTFDYYDPDFYTKFVKGKLLYYVDTSSMDSFMYEYEFFKRGVTEQVINISCDEKQKFLAALYENVKKRKQRISLRF
jgi:hypothetical protein